MKKLIFALASVFTASALTGCGNDPEDVALGMVKAIVNGDALTATSRMQSLPSSSTGKDWPK